MLLSPSLLIVALLSALNLAHASPTPPTPTNLALTCTPNFSGRAQTIVVAPGDPVYAWTPNSIFPGAHITLQRTSSTGQAFKFLVQFTGRADASFVLRLEAETNRYTALTAWRGSDLAFDILALASHP
ncbi:hypothetical protein DXG03_007392 [Asterophora parasitica]|uniref:Uncharacterized protein n=1 Tax=Asterophora parasitica TaxID=117018 RepID=A0A9P7G6H3_9AGAR|nr:hypothetical protein DXG03_007392 [Asterophora parasitica]